MIKKGGIIFLNGVTSSGKTTIAKIIQKTSGKNFYYVSNDVFYGLQCEIYNSNVYNNDGTMHAAEAVVLMYHFAKVLVEQGKNVLIDGMLHEYGEYIKIYGNTNYDIMRDVLADVSVFMVEVFCPLEECKRRNISRGDRGENQSEEQSRIMNKNIRYNFFVDTSLYNADECAEKILIEFDSKINKNDE
ncbi:MAG: chloramphenicol phosphotransferase CPT family protein [Defluviitaleaceae bacterium]|nr:chloramphenicol phosphotransferase CPT family protein [Defluviitaleaceae bacterium]